MSLRTLSLALAGLALTGCAKKSAERTLAPETAADMAAEPDDIDALEAQLAAREDQLRALGAEPPAGDEMKVAGGTAAKRDSAGASAADVDASAATKTTEVQHSEATAPPPAAVPTQPSERAAGPAPGGGQRCESVCEISGSICQLRDNICGLAPRHPDEPRYQRACDRAAADCDFATEACHACA